MTEVTLIQMLDARERRVWEQQRLLAQYGGPIVCFTMNIPGPVKDTPLIRRSFLDGCAMLDARIPQEKILHRDARCCVTGCEAMYAVAMDPLELKRLCVELEDEIPLGRLFDMDVIGPDGLKLDREQTAGKSRDCIVCGAPGRGCASRRIHSVPQLQQAAGNLMREHFYGKDTRKIAALAAQSLREEVHITPKPGLVDRRNTGSHRDMDLQTFEASAAAMEPYFESCVCIGIRTAQQTPQQTFAQLRAAGLEAEQTMLRVTGGVNTHKGAIFTMGLLCGAAGRLWDPAQAPQAQALFREVAAMTAEAMEQDRLAEKQNTAGQRLYARYGVLGARGEAAQGLPSVTQVGLPAYHRCLDAGMDPNMAGVCTLLELIARVQDTNMLHRGGLELAREAAQRAGELLEAGCTAEAVEALDDWFIEKNLSPGGCADLLAAVIFVSYLEGRRDL